MERHENQLVVQVWDNGVGMSSEQIERVLTCPESESEALRKHTIGLPNVNRRLKLYYAEPSKLNIFSVVGQETCVSFSVPWEEEDDGTVNRGR